MANNKYIEATYPDTSLPIYCIISRNIDSYVMDATTGVFLPAVEVVSPYLLMVPAPSPVAGLWTVVENRSAWDNGFYTITIYQQINPTLQTYQLVGSGQMNISNDTEVVLDDFVSTKASQASVDSIQTGINTLIAEATGKWVLDPVGNTLTLYNLDMTVLQVFNLTVINGVYTARTPV